MSVPTLSVALRETCRLVDSAVPLWSYHRARLEAGGCEPRVVAAAERAVEAAARGWAGPHTSRLRLTLVVDAGGGADVRVQRRLSSLDVPGGPVAVAVPVDEAPPLGANAAKPADRSWWDDAQRRARVEGADQALLVKDGLIIDGGTATVWVSDGHGVVTPPAPDAVAGVARAFLLDRFVSAGVPVSVRPLPIEEFASAREAFLTNAFGGAVAIRGRGGELAGLARAEFASVWSLGVPRG